MIGRTIGPYQIVDKLGEGGIGVSSRWGWGPTAMGKKMTNLAHVGEAKWR